jgi:arabinofuranan 3-O-arabinosyltransferase
MNRVLLSDRFNRYGVIFIIVFYSTFFMSMYFENYWGVNQSGYPELIDFGWMWVGARAALAGSGAAVYDFSYFSAAQIAFFGPQAEHGLAFSWVYSPNFLLYLAPFGLLPFHYSLIAWICSTFCFCLAGLRRITIRPFVMLVGVVPCAVAWNVKLGHTGFLAAGLMALSLGLIEDAPFVGGMILGLLTYKPQLGVLFPIVLAASGQWRAIAGATLTVLLLALVTTGLFGIAVWPDFLASLHSFDARTLSPSANYVATLQTVFGFLIWAGCGPVIAWIGHLVLAVPTVALVCLVWRRPVPYALKAAALSAGALIVTPYLLAYDLVILTIPVAFLIKEIGMTGFLRGERPALLAFWALLFLYMLPLGSIAVAVLFGLVLRRAFFPGTIGPLSSGESRLERVAGFGGGDPGGVDDPSHGDEAMDLARKRPPRHRHTGRFELLRIGFAFVAERVVAGGQHIGGRQAGQTGRVQRRGAPVAAIRLAPQILVAEPILVGASQQMAFGQPLL